MSDKEEDYHYGVIMMGVIIRMHHYNTNLTIDLLFTYLLRLELISAIGWTFRSNRADYFVLEEVMFFK